MLHFWILGQVDWCPKTPGKGWSYSGCHSVCNGDWDKGQFWQWPCLEIFSFINPGAEKQQVCWHWCCKQCVQPTTVGQRGDRVPGKGSWPRCGKPGGQLHLQLGSLPLISNESNRGSKWNLWANGGWRTGLLDAAWSVHCGDGTWIAGRERAELVSPSGHRRTLPLSSGLDQKHINSFSFMYLWSFRRQGIRQQPVWLPIGTHWFPGENFIACQQPKGAKYTINRFSCPSNSKSSFGQWVKDSLTQSL